MTATFHNRTRRSASIPRSLLRRGRVLEVPLYYLLRASDLAREGLDHSGSHLFADHIYRGQASGRGPFGRWLDARLLALPATRALRFRYCAARDALAEFLRRRLVGPNAAGDTAATAGASGDDGLKCAAQRDSAAVDGDNAGSDPGDGLLHVLSVPCGIPRDLADAAALVRAEAGGAAGGTSARDPLARVVFHGLDLDAEVLAEARRFAAARGLPDFRAHPGDALDRAAYPAAADFITCTGLAEFLDDGRLGELYAILFDVLRPGGLLFTSGMTRRRGSDYLLRLAEIRTHYRGEAELRRLLERLRPSEVTAARDELGIQTTLLVRK